MSGNEEGPQQAPEGRRLGSESSPLPQQGVYGDEPRDEVRPFIPRGAGRVLDVGCGPGGFGRTLREVLGPQAHIVGIDAVQANVSRAAQASGYDEVRLGYFPADLGSDTHEFDLITFLDVLEHMLDPWSVLTDAAAMLRPGGHVVAAIPNIQVFTIWRALAQGRWDYTNTGILDRTHVRFFTKATMLEMFQSAGLTVVSCQGVNSQSPRTFRAMYNRRFFRDFKWLPAFIPDSRYLQFVIVGVKDGKPVMP